MSAPVHPPPAAPSPASGRRQRWLIAAVTVWAVLLVGLAYRSVGRDEATVPEQRSVVQAAAVVDRAAGEILAGVGPDAVVELREPELVAGCRLTPVRAGATLRRDVLVQSPAGQAFAVLDRVAAALPTGYRARVVHSENGTVRRLLADAGEFVGVRAGVGDDDLVTFTVSTGCRPVDDVPAEELRAVLTGPSAAGPIAAEPGRVLAALGVPADGPQRSTSVPCPARDRVHTVTVRGTPAPVDLAEALRPVAAAGRVLLAEADRYAYRAGPTSVVVTTRDGTVRVAVTGACP